MLFVRPYNKISLNKFFLLKLVCCFWGIFVGFVSCLHADDIAQTHLEDCVVASEVSYVIKFHPKHKAGNSEKQFHNDCGDRFNKFYNHANDNFDPASKYHFVDSEPRLATSWYRLSVNGGALSSQMSLGRMYEIEPIDRQKFSHYIEPYPFIENTANMQSLTKIKNDTSFWYPADSNTEIDEINQQLIVSEDVLIQTKLDAKNIEQEIDEISQNIKKLSIPVRKNSAFIKKGSVPIKGLNKSKKNSEETEYNNIQIELVEKQFPEIILEEVDSQQHEKTFNYKGDVKRLQRKLLEKEQALALAKQQTEHLEMGLVQLQKKKNELENKVETLLPINGPIVTLGWPDFEVVSGVYRSVVAADSVIKVIGAVSPHEFIDEFMINDQPQDFDENGLFVKGVEVFNEPVYLEVFAKDPQGNTLEKLLVIEPDPTLNTSKASGGSNILPSVDFGKYYALVIGNSDYDELLGWQNLDTTINDANAVSKILTEKFGFEVTTKLNVDHDELLLSIEKIRRQLTEKDNLLIYYAGHGYVDPENDQGYWIPVDASADSSVNWISNSTITDQIRAMTARNVMVVADSCYSSTLMRSGLVSLRSGLSLHKKLERLSSDIKTITRVALSAGGLQPVADSIDDSGHSVFANAFLSVLKESGAILDSDALATKVGFIVSLATQDNIRQLPRYAPLARGGHQGGEFYFVPKDWDQTNI